MTEDTPKLCIDCAHCESVPPGTTYRDIYYKCLRVTDVVTGGRTAYGCRVERELPAAGLPAYCGREGKYWTPRVKP